MMYHHTWSWSEGQRVDWGGGGELYISLVNIFVFVLLPIYYRSTEEGLHSAYLALETTRDNRRCLLFIANKTIRKTHTNGISPAWCVNITLKNYYLTNLKRQASMTRPGTNLSPPSELLRASLTRMHLIRSAQRCVFADRVGQSEGMTRVGQLQQIVRVFADWHVS